MRVGLLHVGGALPNIALMRLSTYHKALGDEVVLNATPFDQPDLVYISTLFTWRRAEVEMWAAAFRAFASVKRQYAEPETIRDIPVPERIARLAKEVVEAGHHLEGARVAYDRAARARDEMQARFASLSNDLMQAMAEHSSGVPESAPYQP